MTLEQLLAILLAGGLGAFLKTFIDAFTARRTAQRDDRKQKVEENSSLASGARTLVDASSIIVKMQDEQIEELKRLIEAQRTDFQRRLDAQGAALIAYETRLDREIENRKRVQAELDATAKRLEREIEQHAATKARVSELQQTVSNLKSIEVRGMELIEINSALEQRIFDLSKGVMRLTAQLQTAGIRPEYRLEVPAVDQSPKNG